MHDSDGSLNDSGYYTDIIFLRNIAWIYRDSILNPDICFHISKIWQRLEEDPQYPSEHLDIAVVYIIARLCAEFSNPTRQQIHINQDVLLNAIKHVPYGETSYREGKKTEIKMILHDTQRHIYSKMQQLELEAQFEWRWTALESALNAAYTGRIPPDVHDLLREHVKQNIYNSVHEILRPTPREWSFNRLRIQINPQEANTFINSRF